MTTDIIEVNNFIVLIEQSNSHKEFIQKCEIDGDAVGFAFYGSGNVELEIKHNNQTKYLTNTTGLAISFFGNQKVEFAHKIEPEKPLQSISIFAKLKTLQTLPQAEREIFEKQLPHLVNPKAHFVKGPTLFMTLEMQLAVQKVFNTTYTGNTRLLFLKSQVNELLAHYFALLDCERKNDLSEKEKEQLFQAKDIVSSNYSHPPTITELSKLIGLNSNKLKKNFKELFGIPVYKYIHEERLNKAYELLCGSEKTVQETAWEVGYESLSSFSNAFHKKFGSRPNEVKKQFLSNKS
ncbi:helix-turn-helix domain-containing protein [Flavobacterium foetidum]|uniref:helix-turn-helix domain-containing protein n=1 Tax=Flavobacterium foetidum TaxID=2026681 RepID=UPI00107538A1|nr:AraC family transcriptional regulator [Flavobacterium foetidum]KAF2517006.1 helix-turn-helix transcriptional regulator [Flavobacterium foetidum]